MTTYFPLLTLFAVLKMFTLKFKGFGVVHQVSNTIHIWDIESGQCIRVLEGHKELVRCIRLVILSISGILNLDNVSEFLRATRNWSGVSG